MATPAERSGTSAISLQVRTMGTGNHDVSVPAQATVTALKQALVRPTGLPVERQRIIYGGRVLHDGQALSAAGVQDGHTLHMVEQDPIAQQAQQTGPPPYTPAWEQHPGHPMPAGTATFDAAALMQSMLGGGGGGVAVPAGPGGATIQTQVLGPFTFDAASLQQAMAAMQGMQGGAPPPAGTAGTAGAAGGQPGAGASPFNFGNLFGQPPAAAGRHGNGGARGGGSGGQREWWNEWWGGGMHTDPAERPGHLFSALNVLLGQMEGGGDVQRDADRGVQDLPPIHRLNPAMLGVPNQHRRAAMAGWQRSFVAAAWGVLASAQLSMATRAAVNRVLQAAGAAPLRLSATGGSRTVERRMRSFPLLDDAEGEGDSHTAAGAQALAGDRASTSNRGHSGADSDSLSEPPELTGSVGSQSVSSEREGEQVGSEGEGEESQESEGSESEWEEMDAEEAAAALAAEQAAAAGAAARARQPPRAAAAGAEDGTVADYVSSDEEGGEGEEDVPAQQQQQQQQQRQQQRRQPSNPAAGRGAGGASAGTSAAARAAAAPVPRPLLPGSDLLLLGAVAAGELAHRFLLRLGAPTAEVAAAAGMGGQPARVAAAVARLRNLVSVPQGPGMARDALRADIRMLATHMSRVGSAAAELMRALQYLGSGVEGGDQYLMRAQPGFVRMAGDGSARVSLPHSQLMQAQPTVVDVAVSATTTTAPRAGAGQDGGAGGGNPAAAAAAAAGPGGAGGANWQQMLAGMLGPIMGQIGAAAMGGPGHPAPHQAAAAAAAAGGGRGRDGAAAGRGRGGRGRGGGAGAGSGAGSGGPQQQQPQQQQPQQGQQGQQGVVRIHLRDPQGLPVPLAVQVGGGGSIVGGTAAVAADVSPQMAGMAAMLLGQLGVDPAGQQQLLGEFGGIMQALRQTSVAAIDIPAVSSEVAAAVRQVVAQQSAPLRGALLAAAAAPGASPAGRESSEAQGAASTAVPSPTHPPAPAPGSVSADLEREAASFVQSVVPAVTGEVRRVLQQHLTNVRHSPAVAAFAPYLQELGIDLGSQQGVPAAAGDVAAGDAPPLAAAAAPAGTEPASQAATPPAAAPQAPQAAEAPSAAVPAAAPPLDDTAAVPAGAGGALPVHGSSSKVQGKAGAGAHAAAAAPAATTAAVSAASSAPPATSVGPVADSPAPSAGPVTGSAAGSSTGAGASSSAASTGAGGSSGSGGGAGPSGLGKGFLLPRKVKKARPAAFEPATAAGSKSALDTATQPATGTSAEVAGQQPGPEATAAAAANSSSRTPAGSDAPAVAAAPGELARSRGPSGAGSAGAGLDLASLLGGAAGGGSGGGGGMMGMLQGMMSNPAVMDMVQSPSMQRMAEQMFSGSGGDGGGGGGGLAGMMSAMGPMMGELLGGMGAPPPGSGSAGSARRRGRGGGPAPTAASLAEVLTAALPPEDARRWLEQIEADETKQRSEMEGGEGSAAASQRVGFSEAYLFALPPKAATSLLRSEEDEEEEGQSGGRVQET